MPYTVSGCFEKFRKEVVDLDSDQTSVARSSRDFVLENIDRLSSQGDIPLVADCYCLNLGSFARNTKIRPLDDIDMMVCYNGNGGVYDTIQQNNLYHIRFADNHPFFDDLRNDDGLTLNSRKVINQLIGGLSGVEHYSKAEMHRRQEAATLKLKSYDWNFDIVPCFYTNTGFYLIPDGYGHWKNTDPRKDQMRVTEVNQSYSGNALPLIRLMKYWKKRAWGESVSSYMFEQLMLNCISEGHAIGDSWSKRATSVLGYLKYAIMNPVPDPKGIQGDLNTLDYLARIDLANMARHNHSTAVLARADEALDKPQEAIEKWRSIFGYSFPGYGCD